MYSLLLIKKQTNKKKPLLLCFFELVKFGSFACISKVLRDFPGGPVVEDLLSSAGDKGSISGPGRSHMPWGQRSLCATTTEPLLESPCSAAKEASVP